MKSPFPGMDPYIEERGLWASFHFSLISKIQGSLEDRLPDRYIVRPGERAYIVMAEKDGKEESAFLPDVGVTLPTRRLDSPEQEVAVIDANPTTEDDGVSMRAFVATEYRESFIEIYVKEPDRELVTCIEVLSPANKRRNGPGRDLYLRKRQGMLLGAANLVEIDLLRGGDRMPMMDAWPNSPYSLLVSRRHRSPVCQVWPAYYKRPLPTIPIPLLPPDADVPLDLQPMIESVYKRLQYGRDINYTQSLKPPLTVEEADWLAQQLQQRS